MVTTDEKSHRCYQARWKQRLAWAGIGRELKTKQQL